MVGIGNNRGRRESAQQTQKEIEVYMILSRASWYAIKLIMGIIVLL